MSFAATLLLAVGLAMDATAVSAARGLAAPAIGARHVLLVGGFFGGFQAGMPVLGWLLGARLGPIVQAWDHWIAFGLLAAIGLKMLWEARGGGEGAREDERERKGKGAGGDPFGLRTMLLLSIATSIDALALKLDACCARLADWLNETEPA